MATMITDQDSMIEFGTRRTLIVITCVLCALLEIVDTTIVNVALNDMRGNLGATLSEVGWVVTAYAIANVIVVPMTSWLSAQFGRRNYFVASIIIFTIASFLCGNATNIWELVGFRFLQGLGGGALLVTSQTIMTESFPREKRGMAQALYGMGVIVGPTLGPPLGGYITEHFGWSFIFYINIPLGIIAVIMALQFVRSPMYSVRKKLNEIDWFGIVLLAVSVSALQFLLERGQEEAWFASGQIVIAAIAAALGLYLFIWRELVAKNPIVELRVLQNGNLRIGTILSFILGFGLYSSTFIVPLYTQTILGWTPTQSGMLMVPAAIVTGLCMPIMGRILQTGVPQQYLVAFGMMLFAGFSFVGYSILTPSTGADSFNTMLIIRGVGMAFLFVPITTLSLSTLRGQEIGQGAAFTGMARQLGGSFGIALVTTLLTRFSAQHRGNLIPNIDVTKPEVAARISAIQNKYMAAGFSPSNALKVAYQSLEGMVGRQAIILSYMDIFYYLGFMFLLCIPIVLMIKSQKLSAAEKAKLAAAAAEAH